MSKKIMLNIKGENKMGVYPAIKYVEVKKIKK
jgi:hypothetical protein